MGAGFQMSPPNAALAGPPQVLGARSHEGREENTVVSHALARSRAILQPSPGSKKVFSQHSPFPCTSTQCCTIFQPLSSQDLSPVALTQTQVTATNSTDQANSLPPHQLHPLFKFANSPRPDLWVLERSVDFGSTYSPWQYFARK